MEDLKQLTDKSLEELLTNLRAARDAIVPQLRKAVAEYDRRAILADMKKRYGDRALQIISGAGGIASQEAVSQPKA